MIKVIASTLFYVVSIFITVLLVPENILRSYTRLSRLLSICVICAVSGAASFFINFFIDKKYIKLEKDFKIKVKELSKYKNIKDTIWYSKNSPSIDNTFDFAVKLLSKHEDSDIIILNYTNTGFPVNYTEYLFNTIEKILKKNIPSHEDDILEKNKCILQNSRFLKWDCIFNSIKDLTEKKNLQGITSLFKVSIKTRTDIINSIIKDRNNYFQIFYIVEETLRFIVPNSRHRSKRLYRLNPNDSNPLVIAERFNFLCASLLNTMLSSRYSLAILPARLNIENLGYIENYWLITGENKVAKNPPTWLATGLKPLKTKQKGKDKSSESTEGLALLADEDGNCLIRYKCIHIARYLNSIWEYLYDNSLVLFDGKVIYLKRIEHIYDRIVWILNKKSTDKNFKGNFKGNYEEFQRQLFYIYSIADKPKIIINNNSELPKKLKRNIIDWYEEDLNDFEKIMLK